MEKDSQPKTQPAGDRPPPRPPHRTAVGLGPEDDDPEKKKVKKVSVRINLPPKPSAAPTIKLPSLPPSGVPSATGTTTLAVSAKRLPWWKFW